MRLSGCPGASLVVQLLLCGGLLTRRCEADLACQLPQSCLSSLGDIIRWLTTNMPSMSCEEQWAQAISDSAGPQSMHHSCPEWAGMGKDAWQNSNYRPCWEPLLITNSAPGPEPVQICQPKAPPLQSPKPAPEPEPKDPDKQPSPPPSPAPPRTEKKSNRIEVMIGELAPKIDLLDHFISEGPKTSPEESVPVCGKLPAVPVWGSVSQREVPGAGDNAFEKLHAWDFQIEGTGCRIGLRDVSQIDSCLQGSWVVLLGASQSSIWAVQLANSIAPGALDANRDGFVTDGVWLQMLDVIIEDGQVIYKHVVYSSDPKNPAPHLGAHTQEEDMKVLPRAYAQLARGSMYSHRRIRITNLVAEWWDEVDVGLLAVQAAGNGWDHAKVFPIAAVGLWYAYASGCEVTDPWCRTRPSIAGQPIYEIVNTYLEGMDQTMGKMQEFCGPGGHTKGMGCTVMSVEYCSEMAEHPQYAHLYHALKGHIPKYLSKDLRFLDLWTLTMQMPEECLWGHVTPASAAFTWQALLSSVCSPEDVSVGTLAAWQGETCRSSQILPDCSGQDCNGYHYTWDYAQSKGCTLLPLTDTKPRKKKSWSMYSHSDLSIASPWELKIDRTTTSLPPTTTRSTITQTTVSKTTISKTTVSVTRTLTTISKTHKPTTTRTKITHTTWTTTKRPKNSGNEVSNDAHHLGRYAATTKVSATTKEHHAKPLTTSRKLPSTTSTTSTSATKKPKPSTTAEVTETTRTSTRTTATHTVATTTATTQTTSKVTGLLIAWAMDWDKAAGRDRADADKAWPKVSAMLDALSGPPSWLQWLVSLGLLAVALLAVLLTKCWSSEADGRAGSTEAYQKLPTDNTLTMAWTGDYNGQSDRDSEGTADSVQHLLADEAPKPGKPESDDVPSPAPTTTDVPQSCEGLRLPPSTCEDMRIQPPFSAIDSDRFAFGLARCIASCHVVVGHLNARHATPEVYAFSWGFTWVPWFFMLSGFILGAAELRKPRGESVVDYVSRRMVTIYPVYAVGLLVACGIAAWSHGKMPPAWMLVLQAFLLQAWVPEITEFGLQMQCWFLSCLVVYWAMFPFLMRRVATLSLGRTLAYMLAASLLPAVYLLIPGLCYEDFWWYRSHHWGHMRDSKDFLVVALKFHPLCFVHVFILGTLLARLRACLLRPGNTRPGLQVFVQLLAPVGYAGLAVVFMLPTVRPPFAKLSARLFFLLPLQAAILLGLAGLPGQPPPLLARCVMPLNFLESYSYSVYVVQFICMNLWCWQDFSLPFFMFLCACAVLTQLLVQKPAEKLWRLEPRRASILTPAVLSVLLALIAWLVPQLHASPSQLHKPEPSAKDLLPDLLRPKAGLLDVRLPLQLDKEDGDATGGGVIINPSVAFSGSLLTVAARLHRRSSAQVMGEYNTSTVHVIEEYWHSQILLGNLDLHGKSWDQLHANGSLPKGGHLRLKLWGGLRNEFGTNWSSQGLCSREKWLPKNKTLVRLIVTGPEDPKPFVATPAGSKEPRMDVMFNSYPPKSSKDENCGKRGVSQVYLTKGIDAAHPTEANKAEHLTCGHIDRAEKNWIPFDFKGISYVVYSVFPHKVIELPKDGESRCGQRYSSVFPPFVRLQEKMIDVALRGSAQAVFVDDVDNTPNLPLPHFVGLLHMTDTKTRRYAHFAYRFEPEPPFRIVQLSRQLPLQTLPPNTGSEFEFAFASGLAVLDGKVMITYASGDRDPRALLMSLERLDEFFGAPRRHEPAHGGSKQREEAEDADERNVPDLDDEEQEPNQKAEDADDDDGDDDDDDDERRQPSDKAHVVKEPGEFIAAHRRLRAGLERLVWQ
eukprot:TRINITY_DN620_c1_g1_i1.p1 TRINITY_DN620_c1_g1~~TRINITY_DN620_c1_g1_i1.p1  ORF type:complete len:1811 (+),score=282.52 TRINITY_DN620_c1_g1_i1:106-5538(+)